MAFKLVRIDTADPFKIQLTRGIHPIGRGKFLDCPDKRVSRNHGQLDVHYDSVVAKALHQNPCFYLKKGTFDTHILKKDNTVELSNGDRFGLLPDEYWYEILYCTSIDDNKETTENYVNREPTEINENAQTDNITQINDQVNTTQDLNETERESPSLLNEEQQMNCSIENSPSVLTRAESPSFTQNPESPSKAPENLQSSTNNPAGQHTPVKRCCSPQNEVSPKKVKLTPEDSAQDKKFDIKLFDGHPDSSRVKIESDVRQYGNSQVDAGQSNIGPNEPDGSRVKVEPIERQSNVSQVDERQADNAQPGPSNDQGLDANKGSGSKDDMPPSPVKPQATAGRERCMYGANCYRKNPQHKVQFSHPSDSDWGVGDRTACPYGRGCRRRDPRHWRDHDHPPGTIPPPPPGNAAPNNQPVAVRRRQRTRSNSHDSEEGTPEESLIVTGKRARKPIRLQQYSSSESENEDPYQTDDSDDWKPGKEDYTQSQDYKFTQDF